MRALLMTASIALLALPAVAIARDDRPSGEERLAKMLDGRVAGKPQSCLPISEIEQSTIIDKTAIVYRVGSRMYVNRPRVGADSLDDDQILVTRTIGSQLCSIDLVHLVERGSHFPTGFVSLGEFVPYDRVKPPKR